MIKKLSLFFVFAALSAGCTPALKSNSVHLLTGSTVKIYYLKQQGTGHCIRHEEYTTTDGIEHDDATVRVADRFCR